MSSDWFRLLEQCPWLVGPAADAQVGEPGPFARRTPDWAPSLDRLLAAARVTPVSFDSREFELLGWDGGGWLCPVPPVDVPADLQVDHRELLTCFGGITETYGDVSSWLDNTDAALTPDLAAGDRTLASVVDAYDWLWTDDGLPVPDVSGYYGVSEEANSNLTACHRDTGAVLLFAGDHDFDHVTPLAGCPEYSLYTLDGAPDLRSWVARVADQWLAA